MKKYILLPAMMVAAMLSTTAVKAQEDVNPLLKYVNKENDLKASIGGRMFADVAYYHTEWTPMKSGAAITDARIHASLTYGKLFIYADFGFGNGEFSQKNLFAQYTFKESLKGIHLVKAGYYNEPLYQPSVSFPSIGSGPITGSYLQILQQTFLCRSRYFLSTEIQRARRGVPGIQLKWTLVMETHQR